MNQSFEGGEQIDSHIAIWIARNCKVCSHFVPAQEIADLAVTGMHLPLDWVCDEPALSGEVCLSQTTRDGARKPVLVVHRKNIMMLSYSFHSYHLLNLLGTPAALFNLTPEKRVVTSLACLHWPRFGRLVLGMHAQALC